MRVDRVDVGLGLEDVLHHRQPLVRVEVARLAGDDLDPAVRARRLQRVREALRAVGRDRDPRKALDLDDVALAVQFLGDVLGREHADLVVVAQDRRGRGVGRCEQAVDVDDRDTRRLGPPGDRGQRGAVLRQDDERVRVLRDRLLDLLRLGVGVRGLEQGELDVVVGVGCGLRVLRDRPEPAVIGGRDARDDRHRLARGAAGGGAAVPLGRDRHGRRGLVVAVEAAACHGRQQQQRCSDRDEESLARHRVPPVVSASIPRLRALQQDGAEDDQALGHLLYFGREIELRHQAEDQCEREDAEERADDGRPPAGEARAADHDGADRVELVEVAADGRGAAEPRAEQHGGDAGEQSREHVDAEDRLPHRHAGDPRGLAVAADGDDVAAVARPVEHDPAEDRDREEDVDRGRDPEDPAAAEPEQRERGGIPERAAVEVEQADGQLVVQEQRDASGDREHRERRDEGDDAPVGDGGRVERAEQEGERDRADDEDEAARPVRADHDPAEDAGRGHHRADREVDPGRRDHERHPDREHADDARLGEHVADVVPGRERLGLEDRADDEEQDDHDRERVLLQLERPRPGEERRSPAAPAGSGAAVIRPPRSGRGRRSGPRRGGAARARWRASRRPRRRSRRRA